MIVHFFFNGKNMHRQKMDHIPRIGDTVDLADLKDDPSDGFIGIVEDVWWNPVQNDFVTVYLKENDERLSKM